MNWVAYSLIVAVATASAGVIDKMVLSKWMTKPSGSFFVFGVIETLSGVIALLALGLPRLAPLPLVVALATGAAFGASSLCYFQAVKVEEVTRVVPVFSLAPLVVAVLAGIFLGEVFTPARYLGVLLITVGAFLLTLKRLRGWRFSRGLLWMLMAVVLISSTSVVSKYLLGQAGPWTIFAYSKLGVAFSTLPFARGGYGAVAAAVKKFGGRVLLFTGISEVLTAGSTIFFLFAAQTGYVTLINALISTHPFFLLLFTVLLSVYRPDILKEELGGGRVLNKLIAMGAIFAGVLLIT